MKGSPRTGYFFPERVGFLACPWPRILPSPPPPVALRAGPGAALGLRPGLALAQARPGPGLDPDLASANVMCN